MTYGNVNGNINDSEKRKSHSVLEFNNVAKKPADFETAITASGYGKFHYLLCTAIILVSWAPGIDTSNISVIIPSAECDLKLTFFQKGILNAAVYVGMVSSALIWGYLADVKGRKKILIYGFLSDGICNILSGLSQNFWTLTIFKFISGFIISGPYATVMSYTAEFYRTKDRARILLIVGLFCLSGNIVNTVLAWLIIPQDWDLSNSTFSYNSWRMFLTAGGLPSILGVLCLSFFPESPKFLMSQGRNAEALIIFRQIYSLNSGKSADTYPIQSLENELIETIDFSSKKEKSTIERDPEKKSFIDGIRQILPLFSRPNISRLILVVFIQFSGMLALNTLRLWQPQLFNILEKFSHTNQSIVTQGDPTFCEILDYSTTRTKNETVQIVVHCEKIIIDSSVYMQITIVSATSILAIFFAGIFVNLLGNKFLLCIFYIISVACLMAMNWSSNTMVTLALTCAFVGLMGSSINIVIGITVSLFPTQLRTMAVSLTMMFGRSGSIIGNVLFPVLLAYGCLAPIVALASFNLLALFLALITPKPKDTVK